MSQADDEKLVENVEHKLGNFFAVGDMVKYTGRRPEIEYMIGVVVEDSFDLWLVVYFGPENKRIHVLRSNVVLWLAVI